MRFDEKPKRRSIHLKKSRAELPRETKPSDTEKPSPSKSPVAVKRPASRLRYTEDDYIPAVREKPEKLPEGYKEDETLGESLGAFVKNHKPAVIGLSVILIVALGFCTGIFQRIFNHSENTDTVSATNENDSSQSKIKTTFTQGKFDVNFENTDAGVDIICTTVTDEEGNEKKTCRAKTEEDRKREQEEKEREEQEKKAKEEREKEDQEDREAETKKAEKSSSSSSSSSETTKKEEGPVKATGITSVSGCPAEAVSGSTIVLKASVLPYDVENKNIVWSSTSAAKVVYEGTGNTATVSVESGEKVIISAMSVDGGFSAYCIFPIVEQLTE